MSQSIIDPRTQSLFLRLFRNIIPSVLSPLIEQSTFSYWRMPSDLYFQTYSILAKSTKSAYRYKIQNEKKIFLRNCLILDLLNLLIQMHLMHYHIQNLNQCKNLMNELHGKIVYQKFGKKNFCFFVNYLEQHYLVIFVEFFILHQFSIALYMISMLLLIVR